MHAARLVIPKKYAKNYENIFFLYIIIFFNNLFVAQELVQNPQFIREGTSVLDIVPGKLGDRWLVSTVI